MYNMTNSNLSSPKKQNPKSDYMVLLVSLCIVVREKERTLFWAECFLDTFMTS